MPRKNEPTERTCIVVVQVDALSGKPMQMGLIVDSVEDVLNVAPHSYFQVLAHKPPTLGVVSVGEKVWS